MCFQRKCFLFAQNESRRQVFNDYIWIVYLITRFGEFQNGTRFTIRKIHCWQKSLFLHMHMHVTCSLIFHMSPFASTYDVIRLKCCKCNKHCPVLAILFNSKTSLFHQWAYVCRSKYIIFIRTLLFLLLAIIHSPSI